MPSRSSSYERQPLRCRGGAAWLHDLFQTPRDAGLSQILGFLRQGGEEHRLYLESLGERALTASKHTVSRLIEPLHFAAKFRALPSIGILGEGVIKILFCSMPMENIARKLIAGTNKTRIHIGLLFASRSRFIAKTTTDQIISPITGNRKIPRPIPSKIS